MFAPTAEPLAALNDYHVRYVLVYAGEIGRRLAAADWRRAAAGAAAAGAGLTSRPTRRSRRGGCRRPRRRGRSCAPTRAGSPVEELARAGAGALDGGAGDAGAGAPGAGGADAAVHGRQPGHGRARVEVLADGAPVGEVTVGTGPTEVTVALPAGAGATRLTLHSLDGADTPSALGLPDDRRRLSVALARVELLPRPDP